MKGFLIGLFLWLSVSLQAQSTSHAADNGKITGKVADSITKSPLEYATITVMDNLSGKTLTGGATNEEGIFNITGMPAGTYMIIVESIGYQKMTLASVQV